MTDDFTFNTKICFSLYIYLILKDEVLVSVNSDDSENIYVIVVVTFSETDK